MSQKPDAKKQEVRKRYLELQMMQHQMQQVQQQVKALHNQVDEMNFVLRTLDDLALCETGQQMYVTVTPGIFVRATLESKNTVLVNIGGGAIVERTIPEAKKIVADQGMELRKLEEELTQQLHTLVERGEKLQDELKGMISNV